VNKKTLFLTTLVAILSPTLFVSATTTLTDMTAKLKDTAVTIGGSIVVIGWIIAGILYLVAAGKPEKIQIAKGAMIACVIGTLLVVLASVSTNITDVIKSAFGLT